MPRLRGDRGTEPPAQGFSATPWRPTLAFLNSHLQRLPKFKNRFDVDSQLQIRIWLHDVIQSGLQSTVVRSQFICKLSIREIRNNSGSHVEHCIGRKYESYRRFEFGGRCGSLNLLS